MPLRHVELTASIAAVEHWLGRHDEAHARLTRAWEELPDSSTAEAAVLEIELAVDGLYELDFEHTIEMGTRALATARAVGDASLIAAAAAVLCLGETVAGHTARARARREEARSEIDRLSDAELAPRLEAVLYLAWAENYLEYFDDSGAHAARGIAIARATGDGRLLVPLMLVQNYAFEMQGRLAEATAICDAVVEMARLSASPHELYRALFELGGRATSRAISMAPSRPTRSARASIRGSPAARSRTAAAAPAGAWASRCSRPARSSADARS